MNYIPTANRHGTDIHIWDVDTKLGAGNNHKSSIYLDLL